jgi:hypothetical protein
MINPLVCFLVVGIFSGVFLTCALIENKMPATVVYHSKDNTTTEWTLRSNLVGSIMNYVGVAFFIPSYLTQMMVLWRIDRSPNGLSTWFLFLTLMGVLSFEYSFLLLMLYNGIYAPFISNSVSFLLITLTFGMAMANKLKYNNYGRGNWCRPILRKRVEPLLPIKLINTDARFIPNREFPLFVIDETKPQREFNMMANKDNIDSLHIWLRGFFEHEPSCGKPLLSYTLTQCRCVDCVEKMLHDIFLNIFVDYPTATLESHV